MAAFGQAAPGSWAKVHLTRGQSSGGIWEIDGKYPQARISIGSDPSAGWAVQGPGVRPMHFEIYWDGRHLFVADTQRAGAVTLNGVPVGGDWVQVRGRGEVTFGQAAMLVETSDAAPAAAPADPTSAKRISSVEGPSSAHALPELSGEATRLQDSPWESGASAGGMTSEATRIQEAPSELGGLPGLGMAAGGPKLGGIAGPAAPPPGSRPRLGGDPGAPQFQAKTLMQDELAQSVAEATRMVSMPDNGPSIVVSPGLMPQQQQPMMGQPMGQPPSGQAPFGAPSAPGAGGTGFAAPPGFGEGGPSASGGSKLPLGLTPRMAAMVGALGIAVVVLLFVGFADEEPEYVDPGPTQVAPPPVPPVVPPTPVGVPPTPVGVGVPPTPVGVGVPPTPVGVPPTPVGVGVPPTPVGVPPTPVGVGVPPTPVPPTPVGVPPTPVGVPPAPTPPVDPTVVVAPVDPSVPLPPTPERIAADLVIAGHYAEALPQYQTLAMQHPERPEYSAMVHILEARLRAAQCVNGIGLDGRPCVPGR